jgi:hypothetical protein
VERREQDSPVERVEMKILLELEVLWPVIAQVSPRQKST